MLGTYKESELLLSKGVWFQGDLKAMIWHEPRLQIGHLCLVHSIQEVKCVIGLLFLSTKSQIESMRKQRMRIDALFTFGEFEGHILQILFTKHKSIPSVQSLTLITSRFEI